MTENFLQTAETLDIDPEFKTLPWVRRDKVVDFKKPLIIA